MSTSVQSHSNLLDPDYEGSASDFDSDDEEIALRDRDPEMYATFLATRQEIERTEPQVEKILRLPLLLTDRAELLQICEVYLAMPHSTPEKLNLRQQINEKIKIAQQKYREHTQYTAEDHTEMEELEQALIERSHLEQPENSFKYRILRLPTSLDNRGVILRKFREWQALDPTCDEYSKLKNWLHWAIHLPYDRIVSQPLHATDHRAFLRHVADQLNVELFGMFPIKEQILFFLAARLQNPRMKRCNMALLGPPGTGKTALSRAMARAMNYPFAHLSMGGVSDAGYLKGHEYTYIGAQPGELVRSLTRMESSRGVVLFDEVEKVTPAVSSALLHIIDPLQNDQFRDNYLAELTIDLSQLWFLFSLNELPRDPALTNRLWVIPVPGYNLDEKIQIVTNYLLPRALQNIGLDPEVLSFSYPDVVAELIASDVEEPGVRRLEALITELVTRVNYIVSYSDLEWSWPIELDPLSVQAALEYRVWTTL